ncbi:MAG: lipid-binding SYLF domain-containing protein [Proteobacteria bacterium]|nr:lipid-binding SYLF domain-containing protein [Pseudomonadota bacterium]
MMLPSIAALIVTLVALGDVRAQTDEPQVLVDKARITIETFAGDPQMGAMRNLIKQAKGVLIVPRFLKGGFIVGGSGGSGVLLGREGEWSSPAFFTMGGGSIGLQIGVQVSEVVLLLMTSRAVDAIIHNEVKLGADASVAVGPLGRGAEASTTTDLNTDIFSFSRAKGLFAGVSLEGAVVKARADWNRMYYRKPTTVREILFRRGAQTDRADELKAALDLLVAE